MNTHKNEMMEMVWRGMLAIAAIAVFAMLPLEAMATAGQGLGTALDNLFCNILSAVTGPIGAGIATIAIVVIGIGALMGKVSWSIAIIVALGVALIFGASSIVESIAESGAGQGDQEACATGNIDTTFGN